MDTGFVRDNGLITNSCRLILQRSEIEVTRDKILKRWVKQPPVSPNIQYLRDAERLTAWDQLGERERVLDIASESNVTAGLEAGHVTRLDFSPDAIEYAEEILGSQVDRYEVADPEAPVLPFEDDSFDGAVSIGPYDWKFLDVTRLTDELHRVLAPDGLLVFSVPTPRSPYSLNNWNKYRYFTPDEALDLISPDWRLADYDLVFQYPSYSHYAINSLPERYQEHFVDAAWRFTDRLTERDGWPLAAYLVLGVQPLEYATHLDSALSCLFRPTEDKGFWDRREEKIVRALEYDLDGGDGTVTARKNGAGSSPTPAWSVDDSIEWRYAPFALLGAMQWRASALGSAEYDGKLEHELTYFTEQLEDGPTRDRVPSYGIGPLIAAFSLADGVLCERETESEYLDTARDLFTYSRERFAFEHAEDCLLAYGWSFLYEREQARESAGGGSTGGESEKATDTDLCQALDDALWEMNERLDSDGLFEFENPTTRRHQNQMYALWGFCRAIRVLDKPGYLDSAKRVLEYTIEHRMRPDGAFIWEDVPRRRQLHSEVTRRLGANPPYWDFLYECHQTFFVNAVAEYYRAGASREYDRAVGEAMAWIYGDNPLDSDLVELSGIGVPMRQMTVDGRLDVRSQRYKGSYEIGSYLMALTNLLAGPWERSTDAGSTAGDEPLHSTGGGYAPFR